MRDIQPVINATHDNVVDALNGIADAIDILTILDMAIDAQKSPGEPYSQFLTVLQKALEMAKVAQAAVWRAHNALSMELRF